MRISRNIGAVIVSLAMILGVAVGNELGTGARDDRELSNCEEKCNSPLEQRTNLEEKRRREMFERLTKRPIVRRSYLEHVFRRYRFSKEGIDKLYHSFCLQIHSKLVDLAIAEGWDIGEIFADKRYLTSTRREYVLEMLNNEAKQFVENVLDEYGLERNEPHEYAFSDVKRSH